MRVASTPIRRMLMQAMLLSTGAVLLITAVSFCAYGLWSFRQSTMQQLQILSEAIAANSTAALAFDNAEDAAAVLSAYKADPHIAAAVLYDARGHVFATYPPKVDASGFPAGPGAPGFVFSRQALVGVQP